ncbi:M1 family metallopeptidase [Pontibacter silvestris]|uniref:M1 family metallopeptidase n=1 Tax=Pontibacter silvestris TaxID=2305183 RepID=A0ABW4WZE9_9BACT|nr:M1 family metallopeptidase [Pontibacter silvestris]MCC9136803.1 M1 family metallopeptidase [Pontibacter silvestris]
MKNLLRGLALFGLVAGPIAAMAQDTKFGQLGQELPTPNTYRTASGAPGHQYWQQRADYNIKVELNDENQSVKGSESITYTNNSPDVLSYLWVQLDQNLFEPKSMSNLTRTANLKERMSTQALEHLTREEFDGGFKIETVKDRNGKALPYTINNTMMRVDLPSPLKPGQNVTFSIDWHHNINNALTLGGRSGYEFFPGDGNYLYEMAQWFPRMAVYDDVNGWQHKQFLGSGEFALPFGDYKVSITVPADHVVAGTGELQNANQVLSSTQQKRLAEASKSDSPIVIVTQDEATKAEKDKSKSKKTWVYAAKNVRDFAWASSRKFIWDAMNVNVAGKNILAMSYYPKEGNPLWGQYSTEAVGHTLRTYSKYTIDYPYPVAISVHGPIGGMEYPMVSFNGYRPEADGTYSDRTKYGLISVIIHEVGHNFFPMIINSDERQWTWMDEGLNTFVQYLTEQEWERDYPSRRGEPKDIVEYMKSDKSTQVPIMTNSESVLQFGPNAYGKPATGLNILRETIMGRELFDYAFKEYARRWAFKHPMPADFFRTMEDASGVDLDWFWRGWFYTTDHTDISVEDVKWFTIDSQDPEFVSTQKREQQNREPKTLSQQRNLQDIPRTLVDQKPALKDFYNSYDPLATTATDQQRYQTFLKDLSAEQKRALDSGLNFYEVSFKNNGGLVMPLIVRMEFEDGTEEVANIPAEIWRYNNNDITKVFITQKPVVSFELDPYLQTADTDLSNNTFPRRLAPSRFDIFKQQQRQQTNPMQQQRATSRNSSSSNTGQ